MIFSCTHTTMLAVISFFTAMLAPGVQSSSEALPYAMTNIYLIAYSFLFFNILTFFIASLRLRKASNVLGFILLGHIIIFLLLTLGGLIQSHSGEYMSSLSWGWIFILFGCIALAYAIHKNKMHPKIKCKSPFDIIIGVIGIFVLTMISGLIIYVSQINAYKKTHIIEGTFGEKSTETQSGITLSPAFENLYDFEFIRSNDTLYFTAKTATGYIQYPEKATFQIPPKKNFFTQKNIYTLQSGSLVSSDGTRLGTIKGKTKEVYIVSDKQKTSILIQSGSEYNVDTDYANIRNIQKKDENVYWIANTNSGDILYKNDAKIITGFTHIKKYIPRKEDLLLLGKKIENTPYKIYQNSQEIRTESGFVVESFDGNEENIWYTIKNSDNTYSVFFNNEQLKKSYGDIVAVFLQKNDNGYVFFARRPGSTDICVITRYRGENCGFEAILPPKFEADKNGVIFMGYKNKKWGIYRNARQIAHSKSLPYGLDDKKNLTFFFDETNPEYFLIIHKNKEGYQLNKQGKQYSQRWKNIRTPFFGYNGKIFIELEDDSGWRIAEL